MFLVDIPTFAKVCSLGDVDAAAAYLILAAGTGADNRTSTWSREAVNQRTALNWRKADAAMAKLEQNGLIHWLTPKSARKPRIDLPPVETRKPIPKHVDALAKRIINDEQPRTAFEKGAATTGRNLGWFACDAEGAWSFVRDRPMVKAYLPKSLVGNAAGMVTSQTTIVDRIRMSRDPMALQLLVDLYALQDLAEHGGINRHWLEAKFKRSETSASTGSTVVWIFTYENLSARIQQGKLAHHWRQPTIAEIEKGHNGAKDFYERVQILDDAGALEWAYYLAEDGSDDATLIYPVGVKRNGKMIWTELESIIGGYAIRAACAIGTYPSQAIQWEEHAPDRFILAADRMARQAAVVGIPRLRHRAHTSNTSRWRAEMVEDAPSLAEMFRGIISEKAPELLAEADRRFADFNVEFNSTSTLVQRDVNDTSNQVGTIPPLTIRPPSEEVAQAPYRLEDRQSDAASWRPAATGSRFSS